MRQSIGHFLKERAEKWGVLRDVWVSEMGGRRATLWLQDKFIILEKRMWKDSPLTGLDFSHSLLISFFFFPSLSFGLFRVSFLSYPLPFFVSSSVFLPCLPWCVFSSLQHSSDCHFCHPSHNISQTHKQLIIMTCFLHRGVVMGRGARIAAAPRRQFKGQQHSVRFSFIKVLA